MSDYFIFDDIDTRNYEGISVYFGEVDTTPKRVGEFIEIPNRNGSLFLDSGRYEDVPHTYDIIALSMQNGRNLINALASKVGHYRLEDSFNTGEYYSAVFDTEVEPTVTMERDKITFKVIFTRKPQRFLTSGETAVTVANNGTLTNPTLFEAKPMLKVDGYGTININSDTVTVENLPLGETKLSNATDAYTTLSVTLDTSNLNADDEIYSSENYFERVEIKIRVNTKKTTDIRISGTARCNATIVKNSNTLYTLTATRSDVVFNKGTSRSTSCTVGIRVVIGTGSEAVSGWMTASIVTPYVAATETISTTLTWDEIVEGVDVSKPDSVHIYYPAFIGNSSITLLPSPMYIDLDIGEAYGIVNGVMTSFNNITQLPANLPVLVAGNNTITYDNTVTSLKIVPRWWKI